MAGDEKNPPPSLLRMGLLSRCPRCGKGALYEGYLTVRETCAVCGLNLKGEDSGDGAAFFLTLLIGAIAVGTGVWFEVHFSPPMWALMAGTTILVVTLTLLLLRPAKALLIALQYRHKAGDAGPTI